MFLVLWCLPDYPARAKFLSEEDKKFVQDRIAVKGGGYTQERSSRKEVLATAFSPRMMAHYLAYVSGSYVVFLVLGCKLISRTAD